MKPVQTLIVADHPAAYSLYGVQTCSDTGVDITLGGSVDCGESITACAISNFPAHGAFSGAAPSLTYTPAPGYTGPDSFTYAVSAGFGYSPAATVNINVGDANISTTDQFLATGENQPLSILLTYEDDFDSCVDADVTYTITPGTGPAHGTLTGTAPNLTYTPAPGYEGEDRFSFTVNEGYWQGPGIISMEVVGGPLLTGQCSYRSLNLSWALDDADTELGLGSEIQDYQIYRSTTTGGPYTLLDTVTNLLETAYSDTNATPGTTYYYVMDFQYDYNGVNCTSPDSDEVAVTTCCPSDDTFWVDYKPCGRKRGAWSSRPQFSASRRKRFVDYGQ